MDKNPSYAQLLGHVPMLRDHAEDMLVLLDELLLEKEDDSLQEMRDAVWELLNPEKERPAG